MSATGQDNGDTAGDYIKWMCGAGARAGGAMANLQRGVGSLVRDIGDPCLIPSPIKGSKMLKPEKWHTCFDSDGKVIGFRKALKFIVLGGVDPAIRAEVWEFLLGCYALSSTSEYRKKLRAVRRERYQFLVRQCQGMHPSIGTGELAYAVGSKLMDVRTMSKETHNGEEISTSHQASQNTAGNILEDSNYGSSGTHQSQKRKSCSKSAELVGFNVHNGTSLYNSSNFIVTSTEVNSCSKDSRDFNDIREPRYDTETFDDYPSLPFTSLFSNGGVGSNGVDKNHCSFSVPEDRLRHRDERMHSFQINNNIDLIIESNSCSSDAFRASNSDSAIFHSDAYKQDRWLDDSGYNREVINSLRICDAPEADFVGETKSNSMVASRDRVSEWLWTLHRIVVDVVRTDSHLDFYGESRNMARMSDILAVYAWVDPSTGYCQGMSDLLSPFVVLYEDDADAFWCFEMLLRRMRENFQMEGPTGVMKQLQALWKIMEMTDVELFEHLSEIGAESLHFAFRMLLVLFRRELSFEESLSMWEMMWAADFDEDAILHLEENCLEPLLVDVRNDLSCISCEVKEEHRMDSYTRRKSKSRNPHHKNCEMRVACNLGMKPNTRNPLCGLSGATIWARHQQMPHISTDVLAQNRDDDLPIFCVAAILVINRHKIIRETRSIDDAIKMFNDNLLKINVKRCIRMALKLRKKYVYKLLKGAQND
ncbi:small G protein signaling modulator 1-like isoform X2 [Oryza brachyantha]|uniref:Rab-GAP TBC domain-containing protein n=1 Tax=Oryza brachyantha TaxID=4533 RepID=J3KVJ5_ORYBR|nr:small G protein signaling modulator 1-like isoform X2 [Oryza brachyantha]